MYGIARDVTDSGARRAGTARSQGAARGARRRTHARARRGAWTRCARANAASARSSKTASTASCSSTREAHVLYVEPRGPRMSRATSREELLDRVSRVNAHPDDVPVLSPRRSRRSWPNPANPCPWSGAGATRTATGCGSKASPPTCSTTRRCAPSSLTTVTSPSAWRTKDGIAEQLRRLALLGRITHAIGERQDLGSILERGRRTPRGRAAGGFLLLLRARRRRQPAHGELHRRAQRHDRRESRTDAWTPPCPSTRTGWRAACAASWCTSPTSPPVRSAFRNCSPAPGWARW